MSESHGCPHQRLCSTVPAEAHFHVVAEFSGLAALRVLTVNVRNVGIGTLTTTALDCERAMQLHSSLTATGIESFVLATCNRTEIDWRAMARETQPSVDQLVAPLFVCKGRGVREPIPSMPGHARLSPDLAAAEAADLARLGTTAGWSARCLPVARPARARRCCWDSIAAWGRSPARWRHGSARH